MTIRYLPLTQQEQIALELAADNIAPQKAADLMGLTLKGYLLLYERAVAKLSGRWGEDEVSVLNRLLTAILIVLAMMHPAFDIDSRQPSSRIVRIKVREDVA